MKRIQGYGLWYKVIQSIVVSLNEEKHKDEQQQELLTRIVCRTDLTA